MEGNNMTAMRQAIAHRTTRRKPLRVRVRQLATAGLFLCLGVFATASAKLIPTVSILAISPQNSVVFNQPLAFYVKIAGPTLADPFPTGSFQINRVPASNTNIDDNIVCEESPFDPNESVHVCTNSRPGLYVPVGAYRFRLYYFGDENYARGDALSDTDYAVTKATVHLTLDPPQPIFFGQYPFFIVTATGGYQPTGPMAIDYNTTGGLTNVQCDGQFNGDVGTSDSSATCVGGSSPAGAQSVTAYYGGDNNHFPTQVSDNVETFTVYQTSVALSVTPAPASIALGASTTVTIKGSTLFDTPVIGKFSVTDGEVSCTFEATGSQAMPDSCVLTPSSSGQKTLTASYAGYPGYYNPSIASATMSVTAATTDGVCGSDNGQVLSTPPTNLCSAGTPSAITGNGPWNWTCIGSGSGTTASCSAQLQTKTTTTVTSLLLSPNPAMVGETVVANVSVSGTPPANASRSATSSAPAAASGMATVSGGGATCTATIANGSGSCALVFDTPGTYTITASYGGDASNAPSSATATEVVNSAIGAGAIASAPTLSRWALWLLLAGLVGLAARRILRRH